MLIYTSFLVVLIIYYNEAIEYSTDVKNVPGEDIYATIKPLEDDISAWGKDDILVNVVKSNTDEIGLFSEESIINTQINDLELVIPSQWSILPDEVVPFGHNAVDLNLHNDIELLSEDYDQYEYSFEPLYLGHEANKLFDAEQDNFNPAWDNSNIDTDEEIDSLLSNVYDYGQTDDVVINFDGEIVPRFGFISPPYWQNVKIGDSMDMKPLYEFLKLKWNRNGNMNLKVMNSSHVIAEDDAQGKIYVYERIIILSDNGKELNNPFMEESSTVNIDSSYMGIMRQDPNNITTVMKFIGPVLMVIGIMVTLSVVLISMKKKHSCKSVGEYEKMPKGGEYHIIQQV